MFTRCLTILLCSCFAGPGAASGAERGFDGLVHGLENEFGVHRTHIPMMGLARLFISAAQPGGVQSLNLATFENVQWSDAAADRFSEVVRRSLGDGWTPMVQVHARLRQEYTAIYCGSSGGHWRMIVATIEAHEANVVELGLNPRELARCLREPVSSSAHHGVAHGGAEPQAEQ
jgi:hypothetical protein